MSIIALIPARSGSKGIQGKNFRELGGLSCVELAIDCAQLSGVQRVCVSTDAGVSAYTFRGAHGCDIQHIDRPPELAQDDTPMIAVVQHALEQIPGHPDDIICLLQPTAVFRTPARVREAIQLLRDTPKAESVVSVVAVPSTHHPEMLMSIEGGVLESAIERYFDCGGPHAVLDFPPRRQDVLPVYKRDGTVYAFYRATIEKRGTLYANCAIPLILEPHETCELDTELQWAEVQARWERDHA
jgi:CMP-N,N'-diacetyllegionaminic acid synthase